MRPHAVFNQRARRALALPVIVLASIATLGGAGSAGFKHASAPVQIRDISAFARVGDCAAPVEGTACHFVSATTGWHTAQVELTTIEVQDGQQVFTSDIQCNVSHPKISTSRNPLDVSFHDEIAASDCDFLHGETPAPVVVDFDWSSVAPMSSGSNPCDVSATVNGTSLSPLFCSLLVS
jgi:hypothetical protein